MYRHLRLPQLYTKPTGIPRMPGVLSENDRETVKRTVPKASNKIQAVAVAKLYVAHPNRSRWTFTGLQGAAVLSNDLVGNTFWIKLVDISVSLYFLADAFSGLTKSQPSNRGVIWDQEIYDTFAYNQDRTFFHSFELEECLAGLSFVDEREARQFKKKMDEREKNASKNTRAQPFASNRAGGAVGAASAVNGTKSHSRFGGFSSLLPGHRHSSHSNVPPPAQPIIPPSQTPYDRPVSAGRPTSSNIDLADPTWRPILDELVAMGISEDQIAQNADFIKAYVEEKQAKETASGIADELGNAGRARLPPPPPPAAASLPRLSPQNTGATMSSTTSSRRGPPPAPPPSRRPVGGRPPSPPRADSPPPSPSPPSTPQLKFRAPPPFADAGKFAVSQASPPANRARASSGTLANPGPPPPPRPPKTPIEEDGPPSGFRVPPPFTGERKSSAPPPPPSRGSVPPPPPSRDNVAGPPPPLPPKTPQGMHSIPPAVIPPPPSRNNAPPLPPSNARPIPPPPSASGQIPPPPPLPSSSGPPPPPPLPSSSGPPPPPPLPSNGGPPPPPPLPSGGGPPPPPPPPPGSAVASPLPKAGGVNDLLSSIKKTGGAGGGGLRKVSEHEKRDRSAAAVPGGETSTGSAAPPSAGGGGDAGGGLAGALAAALSQRKKKVSGSGKFESLFDFVKRTYMSQMTRKKTTMIGEPSSYQAGAWRLVDCVVRFSTCYSSFIDSTSNTTTISLALFLPIG